MPTQEERLIALEQNFARFQGDAIKSYQDMAMQVTTTKGLAETTIGRLATIQWQMEQRFNALEAHSEATNAHLTHLQENSDQTDKRLNSIDTRLDKMENLLAQILNRLPEKP